MRKDFFDKETLTGATARVLCNDTTCNDCKEFFGIVDGSCPADLATKEQTIAFMRDLYVALKDKFEDHPDWTDISFEEIVDILTK